MIPVPSRHFLAQGLLRQVVAHPVGVILLISAITVFFLLQLTTLRFKTSIYDLIIEDIPESARYQAFQETFGTEEIIRVVINTTNIWEASVFEAITRFSDRVAEIQGVRRVISLPTIKKVVALSGELTLKAFADLIRPVTLFHRNLLSPDQRRTVVTLVLSTDADRDAVIAAVSKQISEASSSMAMYQIGMPLVSKALVEITQKDFFRIPPVTLALIGVLLLFLFRNGTGVLIPLLCVTVTLVWTLGFIALTRTPLSLLTLIVPVFLIAVGTAYCLHVCSAYFASAGYAASPSTAAMAAYAQITFPTGLAVLTTIIGIGSLFVNKMEAIREFSLFTCFGMTSLLIITMTLLPALMALLPLPKRQDDVFEGSPGTMKRFLDLVIRINLNHQKIAFPVLLILLIVCIAGALRIRVETNPLQYFKKETDVYRNFHDIYQDLSGSFPVNVVLGGPEEDYFEFPERVQTLSALEASLEALPEVDKVISFAGYLKLVNYATNRYDEKYYALPQEGFELRTLVNSFKTLLGEDMLAQFMSRDFSTANILLLTHISSSTAFLDLENKIAKLVPQKIPKAVSSHVTGLGVAVSASSHVLTLGQIKSLSISLVLIFIVMMLLFLSFKVGLIAVVPNTFPIVINLGVMGWFGIPLSMATSLIAGIAIGLAVDDTIHYLIRYNREFKKDLDKDRALRDTIHHIGKPIVFTSVTIALGFSILMFSQFQPTAVFGLLMVVTMVAALVGDLILLPSLMLHVELVTAWDMLRLMPTLSGMSAGVVHELNQPLNAIKMGSDFLTMISHEKDGVPAAQVYQVAGEIGQQVDRASHIIQRLGNLDQKPKFEREPVDINAVIQKTLAIVAHQFSIENVSTDLSLAEDLPPVFAHENRLAQAVYNLLSNAGDAILAKQVADEPFRQGEISIQTFQQGPRVCIQITDSGIGMPQQVTERVFEPFFTTKGSGKGKGLGLTITHEIVRDYGGKITVESHENGGTTVTMRFPAMVGG